MLNYSVRAYTAHPLAGDCNAVEMFRTGPPAAAGAGGKLFQEHRCVKLLYFVSTHCAV